MHYHFKTLSPECVVFIILWETFLYMSNAQIWMQLHAMGFVIVKNIKALIECKP